MLPEKKNNKKTTVEHEGDSDNNCHWCSFNSLQKPGNDIGERENLWESLDHPDHNIIRNN